MSRTGYSTLQIRLHWIIAALLIVQLALHDGIVAAAQLLANGELVGGTSLLLAETHVIIGLTIFILALARIWVRVNQGVPPMPENENLILRQLARLTHLVLYVAIVVMPLSGALAWFGEIDLAATLHGYAKPILLLFVFLHIAGAAYQHLVLKSNALTRMLRSEKE